MRISEAIRIQRVFKERCEASIRMVLAAGGDDFRRLLMDAWQEGYRLGTEHSSAQTVKALRTKVP